MYRNELSVRFNDCDALGHVNNATYLTFFEEARKELFRLFNPSLDVHSWNMIIASTRCDYLREAVYAENLTVLTWIGRLGSSSVDVEQAIQNERGEWVARGKAVLLGYDFGTKKAVKMSDEIRAKLLEHNEAPEGVPALRE
ncbi:acyl-CoA thioesterase [Tumebacillus flagellatus]|uniref:Thioesterase n=1 Tax=Tumebacillus flagellatus TaxID=1157490 RepID=A0A074LNW3_9BACL|nr:thioesterase family protein [Tumebacillus flagellatus]KEO82170.1 thioesterase [Tumebacillus flagellatus]